MSVPIHKRLAIVLAALWCGGSAGLAFVAVPMAFAQLGQPQLAGPLAAQFFTALAWMCLVCGLGLLGLSRTVWVLRRLAPLILLAMLAALLQEHAVADRILSARASGGDLKLWHGLGSALVLLQCGCAAWVLWRLSGTAADPDPVAGR